MEDLKTVSLFCNCPRPPPHIIFDEQQEIIEKLQQKITTLEKENETLKKELKAAHEFVGLFNKGDKTAKAYASDIDGLHKYANAKIREDKIK